jgi:hypothetical protein
MAQRTAYECVEAPTISPPASADVASASRNRRRQPNNCCGDKPFRRATVQTESPLDAISAMIRTFSSSSQMRRRPAPVNTSTRCAGLMLTSLSVTILNLAAQISPQTSGRDESDIAFLVAR